MHAELVVKQLSGFHYQKMWPLNSPKLNPLVYYAWEKYHGNSPTLKRSHNSRKCCKWQSEAKIPLVASRHDMHDVSCVSHRTSSSMADDEESVFSIVLACTSLVFCALDLLQSQEQLLEKVRWTSIPVRAMPLNTFVQVEPVALVVMRVSRRAV